MNIKIFKEIFDKSNETEKAIMCKGLLENEQNNMDTSNLSCILGIISNELNNNKIFSLKLKEMDIISTLFNKKFTTYPILQRNKYSALWNFFMHNENRNISKKIFSKILNDFNYLSKINNFENYNVYFGCLGNLSLSSNKSNKIYNILIQNKNIISTIIDDTEVYNTMCGLIANLSFHNNKLGIQILNSDIIKLILEKNLKNIKIKNYLSMLNNLYCCNTDKFMNLFISFRIIEKLNNIKLKNLENFEHLCSYFNLESTSFHLSLKLNLNNINYKMVKTFEYDINMQDNYGNTVLHIALYKKKYKMAKFYILCDAKINIKNHSGKTALDLNPTFVKKNLKTKNIIKKLNLNKIKLNFENESIKNYEINIFNIIESYINKADDAFKLIS